MPWRSAAGVEHLVIEVDVLDVEGDVLLRFPVDRLGQVLLGHHRQADLLDDDGAARQRRHDILRLELRRLECAAYRVGHRAGVDDRAVDDAVGRQRFDGDRDDLEAAPGGLQLDRLDRAGTDVQADHGLTSVEEHYAAIPSWCRADTRSPRRQGQTRYQPPESSGCGRKSPETPASSPTAGRLVAGMSLTESNPTHSFFRERLTWSWAAFEGLYRHIGPIPEAQVPKRPSTYLRQRWRRPAQGQARSPIANPCIRGTARRGLLELDGRLTVP